jgi:hypothetical protein
MQPNCWQQQAQQQLHCTALQQVSGSTVRTLRLVAAQSPGVW